MHTLETFTPGSPAMEAFRRFPEELYAGDPFWRGAGDPPSDADACCFLVRDGEKVVGRACGMINPDLFYEKEHAALIGWYDCMDDPDAARMLIDAVALHYGERGCRWLIGPMNGSTWHSYRFAEPSPDPPFFLDVHNKPWYTSQFEANGFETIARYYSTVHERPEGMPERVERFEEIYRSRGITIRQFRLDDFANELRRLHELSLAGFARNFLYTPITLDAFRAIYEKIMGVIDPELVLIAEDAGGSPVGFIFAVPNIHERRRRSLVIKTVVVRPDGLARGLGTLLAEKIHGLAREREYDEVIHALMHEKNSSLNVLGERGSIHRSYRLFGRMI